VTNYALAGRLCLFTSTMLGVLVDDGKCELDDSASQHWPALVSHCAAYSNITLRHLASMSGGYLGIVRDVSPEQPWGDPIAYLVPQQPRYDSGAACAYHDHDVDLTWNTFSASSARLSRPSPERSKFLFAPGLGLSAHWLPEDI